MLKLIKSIYNHFPDESSVILKLVKNITPSVIGSKDEAFLRFFWREYQLKYLEGCNAVLSEDERHIEELTRLAGTPPFEDSLRNFFLHDENLKKMFNTGFTNLAFLLNEQKCIPKTNQQMSISLVLFCKITKLSELIEVIDRNKWTLEKALNIILPERYSTVISYQQDMLDVFVALLKKPILFEHRLKLINIPDENIPEKFFDPISLQVMEDPVVTTDFRSYDRVTYEQLPEPKNGPFDRQKNFQIVCENEKLKNEIDTFVLKKEQEHKEYESKKDKFHQIPDLKQSQLIKNFGLNRVDSDKKPSITKEENKLYLKSILKLYPCYDIEDGAKIELTNCSMVECLMIEEAFNKYFKSFNIRNIPTANVSENGVLILKGIVIKDFQQQLDVQEIDAQTCCCIM